MLYILNKYVFYFQRQVNIGLQVHAQHVTELI